MQGGCQVAEMKIREKRQIAKNAKIWGSKNVKIPQTAENGENSQIIAEG
jgi:hypothetical protein